MSGVDTEQTKKVRTFKNVLAKFNIPIFFEDERLSSVSAKKSLVMQNVKTGHNKAEIDRTAAAIILQQFLDKKV
jgi:putative Holliday junction resolvase